MSPALLPLLLAGLGSGQPVQPSYSIENLSLTSELAIAEAMVAPRLQDDAKGVDLSYTYFEIGGTQLNVDEVDEKADIYYARGGLGFGLLHLVARYDNQSIDVLGSSVDADVLSLGVGAHFSLTPRLDLEGDVSWIFNNVSSDLGGSLDDSNNGYIIRFGPRWMVLPWGNGGLELNGDIRSEDVDGSFNSDPDDSVFGYALGAQAHFLRLFSVGVNYIDMDGDDSIGGNVRVSF